MSKRAGGWLGACVVLVGLTVPAGTASAGSPQASDLLPELTIPELKADAGTVSAGTASAPDLDRRLGGSRALGLGLDLSRIQPNISSKLVSAPTVTQGAVATRLIDPDLGFDALSFDLKVRWPALGSAGPSSSLQPYFSFGPALFVARPGDITALGLLGDWREVSMSLGLIGGAGFSWQLGENAALFGEYRFTQSGANRFQPIGGKGTLGRDADTSDLLYGISVRF